MSFAIFKLCQSPLEVYDGKLFKFLPKALAEDIIKKMTRVKPKYKVYPIEALNYKGAETVIPVTKEDFEQTPEIFFSVCEKIQRELCQEGFKACAAQYGLPMPSALPTSYGKVLTATFVKDIVNKALEITDGRLEETSFIIIDGGNLLTDIATDAIYPNANMLGIYTPRPDDFAAFAEEVLDEYGLAIEVFADFKSETLKSADVIINCGADMENYDYYFKKGSIYIDLYKNTVKLKRLMLKRRDMLFIDGAEFNGCPDRYAEAALYAYDEGFRALVNGKNRLADYALPDIEITALTALSSKLKRKDFDDRKKAGS